MTFLSLVLYSCTLFCFGDLSAATARTAEVSENPNAANFLRRSLHATVVLGDFVFIDGGEFSQLVNGVPDPGQNSVLGVHTPYSQQNNVTLSLDLRRSWTNSSVAIEIIPKGSAPVFNYEKLWKDPDGKSCYIWTGELSSLTGSFAKTSLSLWKFTGDGTGIGTWSQAVLNFTTSSSSSQRLFQPGRGGCGVILGDTGCYVGGRVWEQSDMEASADGYFQNTTTLFNVSSGTWNNERYTSIGSTGTISGASAAAISAIGLDGRGLMVILGGSDPGTNVSQSPTSYFELDNVTLYDPYIDKWYAQKASGDVPASREQFCAVTVPGDNGTYEIFIYGGVNRVTWEVFSDVYILSIPGFVWFKTPDLSSTSRFSHTCELVGKRQLLSIGGLDNPQASENIYYDYTVPDPLIQGIGIFDMSTLNWRPMYDPDALPYQSPKVVNDWYLEGNQALVQWQSLELARMFVRDVSVSVSPTPAATATGTTEVTGVAQGSGGGNDREAVIGTATGLGGLIIAVATLWVGWKQYRRMKAGKSPTSEHDTNGSSSESANISNGRLQSVQPMASTTPNPSLVVNMEPTNATGPQNPGVDALPNVNSSATIGRDH